MCVYRDTYRCARSSEWGDRLPVITNKKLTHTSKPEKLTDSIPSSQLC